MTGLHVQRTVAAPAAAFQGRSDAGAQLAAFLLLQPDPEAVVFALPRGGVPVAEPLAADLRAPLRPAFVRKLPLPHAPEMGFGAVALDGSVVLNEAVAEAYALSDATVRTVAHDVLAEVRRRAEAYGDASMDVAGRKVFLVDDGLATGYTALAAARMLQDLGPAAVHLAVPVSPLASLERVRDRFETVTALYAQKDGSFAVASYYESFPDLTDRQVLEVLERANRPAAGP